jgi:hypothetical protein
MCGDGIDNEGSCLFRHHKVETDWRFVESLMDAHFGA